MAWLASDRGFPPPKEQAEHRKCRHGWPNATGADAGEAVFASQDEISQAIVEKLRVRLAGDHYPVLLRKMNLEP